LKVTPFPVFVSFVVSGGSSSLGEPMFELRPP
jgi:hypothetical protein